MNRVLAALIICGFQACGLEELLGTGVNIFKDDLSRPADLRSQSIFELADMCMDTEEINETSTSMTIIRSGAEFRAYLLNTTALPFVTNAVEDTMRQYDPVYETNTDAFTLARKIYMVRGFRTMCLPKLRLQEKLRSWMELLSTNMTTIADWRLWQSLVDSFHLSHVVMSVSVGVQMQIFVSCPDKDQTLFTSCTDLAMRGMSPEDLGCPQYFFASCGAAGGYAVREVTVLGGDPILGVQLIFAKYPSPNATADSVLQTFLDSGANFQKGATLQPLRIESLLPFSDALRSIGQYEEQAEVMDEVIGEHGYIQCLSNASSHWQRLNQNPNGRWLWQCMPNVTPPTPEDVLEMPWVSVVVISGVSSALLVSAIYYICRRMQRKSAKADVVQKRTGNYYKDLAALTSDD